jgi:hypothetical protein
MGGCVLWLRSRRRRTPRGKSSGTGRRSASSKSARPDRSRGDHVLAGSLTEEAAIEKGIVSYDLPSVPEDPAARCLQERSGVLEDGATWAAACAAGEVPLVGDSQRV